MRTVPQLFPPYPPTVAKGLTGFFQTIGLARV